MLINPSKEESSFCGFCGKCLNSLAKLITINYSYYTVLFTIILYSCTWTIYRCWFNVTHRAFYYRTFYNNYYIERCILIRAEHCSTWLPGYLGWRCGTPISFPGGRAPTPSGIPYLVSCRSVVVSVMNVVYYSSCVCIDCGCQFVQCHCILQKNFRVSFTRIVISFSVIFIL